MSPICITTILLAVMCLIGAYQCGSGLTFSNFEFFLRPKQRDMDNVTLDHFNKIENKYGPKIIFGGILALVCAVCLLCTPVYSRYDEVPVQKSYQQGENFVIETSDTIFKLDSIRDFEKYRYSKNVRIQTTIYTSGFIQKSLVGSL